jgi:hypothetical protein
MRRMAPRDKQH